MLIVWADHFWTEFRILLDFDMKRISNFSKLAASSDNMIILLCVNKNQVLWQLLDQLGKIPGAAKMAPLPQWRQDMERYCNSIPAYYGPPLRHALKRWGLNAHVVPDSMENSLLAGFVGTQLKKLKLEAKVIFDADMSRIMVQKLPSYQMFDMIK